MPKQPLRAVFASRLRTARAALGVSQAELGARVGIPEDVASTRINRYERGVHEPSLELAEKLAGELGIPLPALVSRDDAMAELIAGFALLTKPKQAQVLAQLETLLGSKKSDAVREKLAQTTGLGAEAGKSKPRRL